MAAVLESEGEIHSDAVRDDATAPINNCLWHLWLVLVHLNVPPLINRLHDGACGVHEVELLSDILHAILDLTTVLGDILRLV